MWNFIHDFKKNVADQFHEILQSLEICRNADQLYSCLDSDPDYSMKGSVSDLDLVFRRRYQPDPVLTKITTNEGKKTIRIRVEVYRIRIWFLKICGTVFYFAKKIHFLG